MSSLTTAWMRPLATSAILILCAASLNAQTPSPTGLVITEIDDGKTAAVVAVTDEWRYRLIVQSDNLTKPEKISLSASELQHSGGSTATMLTKVGGLSSPPFEIPAATGSVEVVLSAKLPLAGDYSGVLQLQRDGKPAFIKPIRVTRTQSTIPVELFGAHRVSGGNCPTCFRQSEVVLKIQGPTDSALPITASLIDFGLLRAGKEKAQVGMNPAELKLGASDVSTKPEPLAKGGTSTLLVKLSGLAEPGEYSGKVRVGAVGYKPADFEFVLSLRDPWIFAAGFILLGSVVSVILRRYGSDTRPRLIVRGRIAMLNARINAMRRELSDMDDTEGRVLTAVTRPLNSLYSETVQLEPLKADWSAGAETVLARAESKLSAFARWLNLRRNLLKHEPAQSTAARGLLDNIEKAIEGSGDSPTASDLEELARAIDRASAEKLKSTAADLREQVSQQHEHASPAVKASDVWGQIDQHLNSLVADADATRFDKAIGHYDKARLLFTHVLSETLLDQFNQPPAPGFVDESWEALRSTVAKLLTPMTSASTPESAFEIYSQALIAYKGKLSEALQTRADELKTVVSQVNGTRQGEFTAFLEAAKKHVESTPPHGQCDGATLLSSEYKEAAAAIHQAMSILVDDVQPHGDAESATDALTATPAGSLPVAVSIRPRPTLDESSNIPAESEKLLRKQTQYMDWFVDAAALIVSTLLGIIWVWHPNPVWGGIVDWTTALLWGLGLHQVSGYTFDGVLGIKAKMVRP